jgi:hypothetical protein
MRRVFIAGVVIIAGLFSTSPVFAQGQLLKAKA